LKKHRVALWLLKVAAICFILFVIIGPLIGVVLWSFAIKWYWPHLIPQVMGVRYWMDVFHRGRVLDSILLSLEIASIVVALSLVIAAPAAYGFSRYKLPLEKFLLIIFLMPQAFPQLPIFINIAAVFARHSLTGNMWGIIFVHTMASLVFSVWIITATFRSIPEELEQAALNLGASRLKTFFTITLPLAIPGLVASAIFVFLWSMGEFTGAFFIGAPYIQTAPVMMYTAAMGYNMQTASVVALILMIPAIAFMIIIEKYLKAEYIGGMGG